MLMRIFLVLLFLQSSLQSTLTTDDDFTKAIANLKTLKLNLDPKLVNLILNDTTTIATSTVYEEKLTTVGYTGYTITPDNASLIYKIVTGLMISSALKVPNFVYLETLLTAVLPASGIGVVHQLLTGFNGTAINLTKISNDLQSGTFTIKHYENMLAANNIFSLTYLYAALAFYKDDIVAKKVTLMDEKNSRKIALTDYEVFFEKFFKTFNL